MGDQGEVPLDPVTGRRETDPERVDRNLQEMLGELRVALPGVQVLFAFLLVVPFNQRFTDVTEFQKALYLVTLLFTTASAICLIAPTVHHRLEFRRQQKAAIVKGGNVIVIVGLALLAIAMTMAVVLVTDFIYGPALTVVAAGGAAVTFAVLWYAIPLRRILADRR